MKETRIQTVLEFKNEQIREARRKRAYEKARKIVKKIYQKGFNNMGAPRIFDELGIDRIKW